MTRGALAPTLSPCPARIDRRHGGVFHDGNQYELSPSLHADTVSGLPEHRRAPEPSLVSPVLHHYCIVRRDLPGGLGGAQLIHAAGESGRLAEALPSGTHAIALTAHSEAALAAIGRALDAAGFRYVPVVESDAPYTGQLMALGLAPVQRTPKLKRILGHLPKLE